MTCLPPRLAAALLVASGCATSIYYPAPLEPAEGWVSACAAEVDATVTVDNGLAVAVDVHELLPVDGCPPSFVATVAPGESAALGPATGAVWRVFDPDAQEWLGTFVLEDGENVLVLP